MDLSPLAAMKTPKNAAWFADDPKKFWHAAVFGKLARPSSS
jgi:hypothetical protein